MRIRFSAIALAAALPIVAQAGLFNRDTADEQRAEIQQIRADVLARLYEKKFSAVFVFHDREAFEQFVDKGWNFTGQADAAATTDAEEDSEAGAAEGVVGLNEGVSVYQLTEKGLALQVTLQGTRYWKDDDLN